MLFHSRWIVTRVRALVYFFFSVNSLPSFALSRVWAAALSEPFSSLHWFFPFIHARRSAGESRFGLYCCVWWKVSCASMPEEALASLPRWRLRENRLFLFVLEIPSLFHVIGVPGLREKCMGNDEKILRDRERENIVFDFECEWSVCEPAWSVQVESPTPSGNNNNLCHHHRGGVLTHSGKINRFSSFFFSWGKRLWFRYFGDFYLVCVCEHKIISL